MDVSLMELVPLDQADGLPVQAIGGKAARLATLRTRGYSVPDGFILTTAIHEQAMRRDGDRDEHGDRRGPAGGPGALGGDPARSGDRLPDRRRHHPGLVLTRGA